MVLRVAGGAAGLLAVVFLIAAGVGWLYLLDKLRLFGVGPRLSAALPLEDLAARGAQPLGRMAVAWLPVGVAATLALGWLTRLPALARVVVVAALTAAIMFPMTAAFEALTRNERFSDHVGDAFSRGGPRTALALVVIGSALTAAAAGRGRRDAGRAASAAGAFDRAAV